MILSVGQSRWFYLWLSIIHCLSVQSLIHKHKYASTCTHISMVKGGRVVLFNRGSGDNKSPNSLSDCSHRHRGKHSHTSMYAHTHFHHRFSFTVVYNLDHTQANTVVLKNKKVPPPLSHSPQTYFYSLANIVISKSTLTLTKISQGISGCLTCSELQKVKAYISCYFCPCTCAMQPAHMNEYGSSWMSGNRSHLYRWETILKVSYFHNAKAKQPHT